MDSIWLWTVFNVLYIPMNSMYLMYSIYLWNVFNAVLRIHLILMQTWIRILSTDLMYCIYPCTVLVILYIYLCTVFNILYIPLYYIYYTVYICVLYLTYCINPCIVFNVLSIPVHDSIDDSWLQIQQHWPRDVVFIISLHQSINQVSWFKIT